MSSPWIEFSCFTTTLLLLIFFHRFALVICGLGIFSTLLIRIYGLGNLTWLEAGHLFQHDIPLNLNVFTMVTAFGVIILFLKEAKIDQWLACFFTPNFKGAFSLLFLVFCLSPFFDNIAMALWGGLIGAACFKYMHPFYILAIAALANAGGSGSVIGDTSTTLLWLSGISAVPLLSAFLPASVAGLCCAIPASFYQSRYYNRHISEKESRPHTVLTDEESQRIVKQLFLMIVPFVCMISVHLFSHMFFPTLASQLPLLGLSLWLGLLLISFACPLSWVGAKKSLPEAFLVVLFVLLAALMPVHALPTPSVWSTFSLGLMSSFFDNIPLTLLAAKQGGYDWGLLAYAVGFGGSASWFGSTAGVCLSGQFPQIRQVKYWMPAGAWILVSYTLGYLVYLLV